MIGYAKKTEKIILKSAFDKKKKKPGLEFDYGLALSSNNWGPFLESPGNLTGPKSNIQIEI